MALQNYKKTLIVFFFLLPFVLAVNIGNQVTQTQLPSNVVLTNNAQDISGLKNFTNLQYFLLNGSDLNSFLKSQPYFQRNVFSYFPTYPVFDANQGSINWGKIFGVVGTVLDGNIVSMSAGKLTGLDLNYYLKGTDANLMFWKEKDLNAILQIPDFNTVWTDKNKFDYFINQLVKTTSSPTFANVTASDRLNFGTSVEIYSSAAGITIFRPLSNTIGRLDFRKYGSDNTVVRIDDDGVFWTSGNLNLTSGTGIAYSQIHFLPSPTASLDLGSSSSLWRHFYLSGNLSDGTNALTIANMKDAYDKRVDSWTSPLSFSSNIASLVSDFNSRYPSWQDANLMLVRQVDGNVWYLKIADINNTSSIADSAIRSLSAGKLTGLDLNYYAKVVEITPKVFSYFPTYPVADINILSLNAGKLFGLDINANVDRNTVARFLPMVIADFNQNIEHDINKYVWTPRDINAIDDLNAGGDINGHTIASMRGVYTSKALSSIFTFPNYVYGGGGSVTLIRANNDTRLSFDQWNNFYLNVTPLIRGDTTLSISRTLTQVSGYEGGNFLFRLGRWGDINSQNDINGLRLFSKDDINATKTVNAKSSGIAFNAPNNGDFNGEDANFSGTTFTKDLNVLANAGIDGNTTIGIQTRNPMTSYLHRQIGIVQVGGSTGAWNFWGFSGASQTAFSCNDVCRNGMAMLKATYVGSAGSCYEMVTFTSIVNTVSDTRPKSVNCEA